MRLFFVTCFAFLAGTAIASAVPVAVGSFIINSFLAAGAGAILPTVSAAAIGATLLRYGK